MGDDRRGGSGLDPRVTRRDFVNTSLAGAGAALLGAPSPAEAQAPGAAWTGYGGVGDYGRSNGDTAATMNAGHRIRDGAFDTAVERAEDSGETYDLVIVGGGFTGLGALLEFRTRRPAGTCLLLDDQEVFGGFAKSNAFDVDGVRLEAPQASMNFIMPRTPQERTDGYWDELGLPNAFEFAERTGGDASIVFQRSTSSALYHGEQSATVGYRFTDPGGGRGRWVKDVWNGDLARAPWPQDYKASLLTLRDRKRAGRPAAAELARLDSLTFEDFATRELGVTRQALSYITQGMCITGPQVSAFGAQSLPGIDRFAPGSPGAELGARFISFPGGNTTLLRHFVKAVLPEAIRGPRTFSAVASNPIDASALDRAGAPVRIRLGATAVRVRHEGRPKTAAVVGVVYEKGGRLHRVRARAVVMAIGAWVTKHVVADLPAARRAALDRFLYSPVLIVNVALRNWRFLDRLGVSAVRWSGGFGFYAAIRQPMVVDGRAAPFHPDRPIVMTFYVPIQSPDPGLPLEAQGPAARAQMYAASYADYEGQVVRQMRELFAGSGFDARRDIAGVVLNRWGHAFVTPPPGFFFGRDGGPSPLKVAAEPLGRIAFGQSGLEDWLGAAHAGKRAATQAMQAL